MIKNRMINKNKLVPSFVCVFLILLISPGSLVSEETADSLKTYRETLKFGIETEVLSVLNNLVKENNDEYNTLLRSIIVETRSAQIKNAIYKVWTQTHFTEGTEYAKTELESVIYGEDIDNSLIKSVMVFLAEIKDKTSIQNLLEIADFRNESIASAAVRAIGAMAEPEQYEEVASRLLEKLQNADPLVSEDYTLSLIVALGKVEYLPAAEYLVKILEDLESPTALRRQICISIGQIGRDEDYELIESIYSNSEDAMMRFYALNGLTEFPNRDVSRILIQALKRDPYWRIRVHASEQLREFESEEIDELLVYKIENDPVNQVRLAAVDSLGKSIKNSSHQYLIELFQNEKKSVVIRLAVLNTLITNRLPGTINAVSKVMAKLWEEDKGRLLEFISRELSLNPWNGLESVYARMLTHKNWLIRVYGIRAVRKSETSTLYGKIEEMNQKGQDEKVLREIRR